MSYQTFCPSGCTILHVHQCVGGFQFFIILTSMKWCHLVCGWIFLMGTGVEHLSMGSLAICVSSLKRCDSDLSPIFKLGFLFIIELSEFFMYSWCKSLIIYMIYKICPSFFWLSVMFLMIPFDMQKLLIYMMSCLYFLLLLLFFWCYI